jgi:ferritin-like metal-binding protein YciE
MSKVPSVEVVEMKAEKDKAEGSKVEKMLEIFSPSTEVTASKTQKSSATTPKRRRMASVLDVVLETAKTVSCTPSRKIAEASKTQPEAETNQAEVEAATIHA